MGYKNQPTGNKLSQWYNVALQSATKTGLKPIISHMENAPGRAALREKHTIGWVPNPGGVSENTALLIKNLILRLLLVISV